MSYEISVKKKEKRNHPQISQITQLTQIRRGERNTKIRFSLRGTEAQRGKKY